MVLCAGCTRLPESFPPPEQRVPLTVPRSGALGYYFSMADPNADAYLVKDVADSGPVTLTFTINGKLLDRLRCEKSGEQHYAHDVPPGMLRAGAINMVAIDPDPVWVSKADGGRLGFILSRAGFTE